VFVSVEWHPVLDHFFSEFTKENSNAVGIRTEAMENAWIGDTASVHDGWYRVCATKIAITVQDHIYFTGRGLLAGQSIYAMSSRIVLEGKKDKPLKVVGIDEIQIEASDLSIKNVVFYVFDKINFSLKATKSLTLQNVKLVKLGIVRSGTLCLSTQQMVHWKKRQVSIVPQLDQRENALQDESALSIKYIELTAISTNDEKKSIEYKDDEHSSVSAHPKRHGFWKSLVLGTLIVLSWASLLFLGYFWYKRGGRQFLKSLTTKNLTNSVT
jgi:hypothetical protein